MRRFYKKAIRFITISLVVLSIIQSFGDISQVKAGVQNDGVFFIGSNASSSYRVGSSKITYPENTVTSTKIIGATAVVGKTEFVITRALHTKAETLIVGSQTSSTLVVAKCSGMGCNATSSFSQILQVSSINTMTTGTCNSTMGGECWRTFHMERERLSDELMIAYGKAGTANAGKLFYTIYNGNTTTTEQSMNYGGATTTLWVNLTNRFRSNEILLTVADNSRNLYAGIWNGSNWGATTSITTNLSTIDQRPFDGDWEGLSGTAVVAWGEGTTAVTNPYRFKKYVPGVGWDGVATDVGTQPANCSSTATSANIGRWIRMARNDDTNMIATLFQGSAAGRAGVGTTPQAIPAMWYGSSSQAFVFPPGPSCESGTESQIVNGGDVEWEKNNNGLPFAIFVYDSSGAGRVSYTTWTGGPGGYFSIKTQFSTAALQDDSGLIRMTASPNNDEIMVAGSSCDDLVQFNRWNGSSFSSPSGAWRIPVPVFYHPSFNAGSCTVPQEGSEFEFVYIPYRAWSMNWQWGSGTSTSNTPEWLISTQNATATEIADTGQKLRLRFNVAELAGGSQTDARKRLQYTTTSPYDVGGLRADSSSSIVWTDVGNPASTSQWVYFDCDPTTTVCNDGVAVGATALASSTAVGWWNTEISAAASTTMDLASTTIKELEFPIMSNSAIGGLTYYFRMFDNDQLDPVFRRQAMYPTSTCYNNSYCTYPALVVATPSILGQHNFRWYMNNGSTTPTGVLANENTSTTVSSGDILRLRMSVSSTQAAYPAGNIFKLQYASSTSGPWYDVGKIASSTEWIGYDNTTTTDGGTLPSTKLTGSTVAETYEEENPSAGMPSAIPNGGIGEWDWVIKENGALANQNYYFRMVKSNDAVLNSYGNYAAITTSAPSFTISGTCKQFDQSNNCPEGLTVKAAINTSLQGNSGTTSGGSWSFNSNTPLSGDVITIFIDSPTSTVSRAAAVTKYDGSGTSITGVGLMQGHLILGSDDNQIITNANIGTYDNSVSGDADVFFEVNTSNNLTVDYNSSFPENRLLIQAGNTYQPDSANLQRIISTGNLQVTSTATLTAGASIFRLAGSWVNNGTFTAGTSTIEFSGSGKTITHSGMSFYNLTASSTASATTANNFNVSGTLNVVGILAIDTNKILGAYSTTTLAGTISGPGTFVIASSSIPSTGTINTTTTIDTTNVASVTLPARTWGSLVQVANTGGTTRVLTMGAGTHTFSGNLNLLATSTANITLDGSANPTVSITGDLDFTGAGAGTEVITSGSGTWTVSGNANFTDGTYTASTGNTLKMAGTGTLTPNNNTLKNLEINSSGVVTLAAGTTTIINGNFTLAGSGTPVFTNTTTTMTSTTATIAGGGKSINNLNIDPSSAGTITLDTSDLTVAGTLNIATGDTLSIASGRTLTHSGSTLTMTGGTISGAGRLTYQSATTFPIDGTISSILRFNTTINNQTMPARIYGGAIEIDNSGATDGRTVTMAAGAHTINAAGLTVLSSGTGSVSLVGATYSPTVNVTGTISYTAGGGVKTITTGTSTWTVSQGVNLTNGTFTAAVGNTLVMSGTGTLTSNGQALQNTTLFGTITLAGATHAINGNLNLTGTITAGASTITMTSTTAAIVGGSNTLNNLTIDPSSPGTITLNTSDLTVAGTLNVASGDTLSLPTGRTLNHTGTTLTLDGTISGAGKLAYYSATAFPTGGTISSILQFNSSSTNQIISARTYSNEVQIENTGTAARNVILGTAGSQTITFTTTTLMSTGSGGVTLTAETYNPDIAISNFSVSASAANKNLNLGNGTTTVSGNFNLSNINTFTAVSGHTLKLTGSSKTLTTNSKTFHNVDLSGATTPTVSGNLAAAGNVTFPANTTLTGVTLTMTGSGKNLVSGGNTIPNLTIDGTAASVTLSTNNTVISGTLTLGADDTLSIASGKLLTTQSTITLPDGGTIGGTGTLIIASSSIPSAGAISAPVRIDISNVASVTSPARVWGGAVEVANTGGTARVLTMGAGTHTFSGNLNLLATSTANVTLDGSANPTVGISGDLDFTGAGAGTEVITSGSGTWTVSGSANFTDGTYNASTGNTLKMAGTGTLTTNSNTLKNLEINSSGVVTLASAATTTVSGNFTLAGSGTPVFTNTTVTMTSTTATIVGASKSINNLTIDPSSAGTITLNTSDLTVAGTLNVASSDTLSIASGRTLTHSSSTLTMTGATISGAGRLTYQSATAFPTAGTISSILRFNTASNDQTMSARTYGGAVEAVNGGSSDRIITLATGSHVLSSDLTVYADGTGNLTLDASSNNPTLSISGNVAYSGTGEGQEIISAGSSNPITVSGNLDISNGSFTAPSSNLTIGGNFTNNSATFASNNGTVIFNGGSQQTLNGSTTFNIVRVQNNSGSNPDSSPSIIFNSTTTASNFVATSTSSKIRFGANKTYNFNSLTLSGQAVGTRVALRSSASGTPWYLNIPAGDPDYINYADVRDSDASLGDEVHAMDGTSLDSGGNVNWAFVLTSPSVSSTVDDVFEYGAASTAVSNISIRSGGGSPSGRITAAGGIRLKIPAGFNATWDPTIGSITCVLGDSCSSISTSGVTYESGDKIAVVNVLSNLVKNDTAVISGLKMKNFTTVSTSTPALSLRVDGVADATDDATDVKNKTIKGKVTEENHGQGQFSNTFDISETTSLTGAELFRFKVVPVGEAARVTTTINLNNVNGFVTGNLTNAKLYLDINNSGSVDGGDIQVGGTGSVSISGSTGSISFSSWIATSTYDVILNLNVSGIDEGDNMTFSLPGSNLQGRGETSSQLITTYGIITNINHGKPVRSKGGGGSVDYLLPLSAPVTGGSYVAPTTTEGTPPPGGEEGGGEPGGDDGGSASAPETKMFANILSVTQSLIDYIKSLFRLESGR